MLFQRTFHNWVIQAGILLLMLCTVFEVFGQNDLLEQRVRLDKNKVSVRKLLNEILPKKGINISYSDQLMPLNKKLNFHYSKPKLASILFEICKNEALKYDLNNNEILFYYYDRPDKDYSFLISGKVRDKSSGELLSGASISIQGANKGVITNDYGYFSLRLPKGKHSIVVSYLGYREVLQELYLDRNMKFDYQLKPQSTKLEDILIDGKHTLDAPLESVMSGVNKLNMEVVGDIPYFMGEVDVFQGALLLPGVLNVGEGASGINVRGGASDENLILMDETVIYNAHHLFGLTSVFNPDVVKDVELFKGSFPSKYGGRLSSVMHIRQREGNNKEFRSSGGIGLITSRLLVEGPIKVDTSSFLLAARTTFWDMFTRIAKNPTIRDSRANFQDFNAKINYSINAKNKIYLSGYVGSDENKFGLDVLKKWGNKVFSLRWNKIHSEKLFYNFTFYMSRYEYSVLDELDEGISLGTSEITDYALKGDFTYFFKPNNLIEYGISMVFHQLSPGNRVQIISEIVEEIDIKEEQALEVDIYIANERNLSEKLKVSYGVRASMFSNRGAGEVFEYKKGEAKSLETIIDTLEYTTGQSIQNYYNLQPQLSLNYQITKYNSLKFSYLNAVQYMHLLSNTLSPTSSDNWKLSDKYVLPSVSNQFSLGYYTAFKKQKVEASVEVFYKYNADIVEYKNGADLQFNNAIETELLTGNSRAYGLEFFVKKDIGNLSGWLSYTLSKSEKRVAGEFSGEAINDGEFFPTDYDRTHDFSLAAIYKANSRWTLSSNFVYYTGRPFSFPDSKYTVDGLVVPHYPNRNLQRLNSYHRLDFSARLEGRRFKKNGKEKKSGSHWVFSIYNLYNRKNTQAYFFRQNEEDPTKTETIKYSVLGFILPSVTYNFRF